MAYSRPASAVKVVPSSPRSRAKVSALWDVVPRPSIRAVTLATPFWSPGSAATPAGTRSSTVVNGRRGSENTMISRPFASFFTAGLGTR